MKRFAIGKTLELDGVTVSVVERTETSATSFGTGVLLHGCKAPHALLVRGRTGRFAIRPDGRRASIREIADECGLDELNGPGW